MLILFVLVFEFTVTDGRVFCQDINASPWQALGPPCPITCSTIITAVDRLKINDYQYLLNEKFRANINISTNDLYNIGQQIQESNVFGREFNSQVYTRRHLKLYNTYHRLLSNDKFPNALKKELWKIKTEFKNGTCSNIVPGTPFYKKLLRYNKCTRRMNKRPKILEKFTKFLNRYADPKYPFDEEMAEIILKKLEGSLNLRYGEVDYKKVLSYLRKALRYHGSKTKSNQIIGLQSSNCINIYMPGCFCKTGYVEKGDQCVKPGDCMVKSAFSAPFATVFAEYMERIILL